MELVVEQAAFAADEVGVEVVGLEAVDDRRALADLAALEVQDRHAAGVVFVGAEDLALRFRRVAADALHFLAHAQQQRVERVAAGGEQRAAAVRLARVPAELAIPRPDAVVVIDLAVVQVAEQALVDDRLGREELR